MRASLMTISIIILCIFIFSMFFLQSFDPGRNEAIIAAMILVQIGSITLAILSYRYAASIGRSAIKWALGALIFPFIAPLILCFLQRPYSHAAVLEREVAPPVYDEPPSKDLEISEPQLTPSEIFLNSKYKTTYKNALKQIKDQDVLNELLENVQEKEKIALVLQKIKDQSIIEKFAQEHPDNGIRITAIKKLKNPELIAQIAMHDKCDGARMAAAANIIDTVVLGQISQNDSHPGVRETARKVLGKSQKFKKAALSIDTEPMAKIARRADADLSSDKRNNMTIWKEKDNRGTRQETMQEATAYWLARNFSQKFEPFVLYAFDHEENARNALLQTGVIHNAKDSGKLICTETLLFGYYKRTDGKYEAIVCGDDLTREFWVKTKECFLKHGGILNNEQEPTKNIGTVGQKPVADMQKVKFLREDSTTSMGQTAVYRVHSAPDAESAKAFLEQNPVNQKFFFLVVETPEGNYCRDIAGIYKE